MRNLYLFQGQQAVAEALSREVAWSAICLDGLSSHSVKGLEEAGLDAGRGVRRPSSELRVVVGRKRESQPLARGASVERYLENKINMPSPSHKT